MFSTVNTSWANAGYFIKHCGKSFHLQECPEIGKKLQTELFTGGWFPFTAMKCVLKLASAMVVFLQIYWKPDYQQSLGALGLPVPRQGILLHLKLTGWPRSSRSLLYTGPQGWARATQGTRLLRSSCMCSRHFTDLSISPAFLKSRTIGTEII